MHICVYIFFSLYMYNMLYRRRIETPRGISKLMCSMAQNSSFLHIIILILRNILSRCERNGVVIQANHSSF